MGSKLGLAAGRWILIIRQQMVWIVFMAVFLKLRLFELCIFPIWHKVYCMQPTDAKSKN